MNVRFSAALRRTTTALTLGGAVALAGAIAAPAAFAADAPLPPLTVQPALPTTADEITISGSGCVDTSGSAEAPYVIVIVDPSDAQSSNDVEVNADGTWSTTGTVTGAGSYSVRAICFTYNSEQEYPATSFVATPAAPAAVTVSPTTVTAGGTVAVSGINFRPGESVGVVLNSTPRALPAFTADGNGSFTGSVVIPADIDAGQHTLVFTGTVSGRVVSVTITVRVIVTVSAKGGLANTGTPAQNIALAGLGLVGLGTTLTMIGRRRPARSAA